jgi:hypothetical protein
MEALESLMRRAQGQVIASGPAEPTQPIAASSPSATPAAAPAAKPEKTRAGVPKIGRNAVVRIRKGSESLEIKWKKAEAMVRDEGWEYVETVSE